MSKLNAAILCFSLLLFWCFSVSLNPSEKFMADRILGHWSTEKKDLKVRVYEYNGKYCAKLTYFSCSCPGKNPQEEHKDTKNPDPKCRSNAWLETNVLWNLAYSGNDRWENGFVYNPVSGSIYNSVVSIVGNKIEVRGYWGFELIGKTLTFVRENY